jgi:hypothetical protein
MVSNGNSLTVVRSLCFGLFAAAVLLFVAGALVEPAYCSDGPPADSSKIELPTAKGALLRSAIYPGWGQLSNGKPYKACVVMAVEAYLAGVALSSDRRARDAKRLARGSAGLEQAGSFEDRRTRYEDRRNAHFWWLGAAILYSMLDAYVDASLAGVSEGGSKPVPVILSSSHGSGGGVRFGIVARF